MTVCGGVGGGGGGGGGDLGMRWDGRSRQQPPYLPPSERGDG